MSADNEGRVRGFDQLFLQSQPRLRGLPAEEARRGTTEVSGVCVWTYGCQGLRHPYSSVVQDQRISGHDPREDHRGMQIARYSQAGHRPNWEPCILLRAAVHKRGPDRDEAEAQGEVRRQAARQHPEITVLVVRRNALYGRVQVSGAQVPGLQQSGTSRRLLFLLLSKEPDQEGAQVPAEAAAEAALEQERDRRQHPAGSALHNRRHQRRAGGASTRFRLGYHHSLISELGESWTSSNGSTGLLCEGSLRGQAEHLWDVFGYHQHRRSPQTRQVLREWTAA
uniref:(northern house mosquito) hypothetical protein n=1 Tax=Culex pipiens TaxID=7175 RepID=A0A8D8AL11_CULPI